MGISSSVSTPRTPSSGISSSSASFTQCFSAISLMRDKLLLDLGHDALTQFRDVDPVDDVPEVATNDQTPGLLRGDAARTQVEQMGVLQASAGTGVSGALDLTGEDLQVRYRVDPGPVRELQVAVVLVGVGTVGAFTDDHITDPDRVSTLTAQRTLVVHPGAGVGQVVVDERTVLVVLLVTGEVEPVQLRATASAAVGHLRRQTHQITAQGDDDRLESGVLADHRVVLADLDGVVVPLLQADQGEVGALSDVDVQAAGTHTGAGV